MSFTPGTVLTRKIPLNDPYDTVTVKSFSPVQRTQRPGEWAGQLARTIIVQPEEFAPVRDVPFGQLKEEYEIVSIPERPVVAQPPMYQPPPELGPSPEEQFAEDAHNHIVKKARPAKPGAPTAEDQLGNKGKKPSMGGT